MEYQFILYSVQKLQCDLYITPLVISDTLIQTVLDAVNRYQSNWSRHGKQNTHRLNFLQGCWTFKQGALMQYESVSGHSVLVTWPLSGQSADVAVTKSLTPAERERGLVGVCWVERVHRLKGTSGLRKKQIQIINVNGIKTQNNEKEKRIFDNILFWT